MWKVWVPAGVNGAAQRPRGSQEAGRLHRPSKTHPSRPVWTRLFLPPFLSLPLYPCPFYILWSPEITMTRVRLHGLEGTLCTSEAWDLDPCPRCPLRISPPPSAYACSTSLVPMSPALMSQTRKKTSLISSTCLCLGCKADPSNSMQSPSGCHTSVPWLLTRTWLGYGHWFEFFMRPPTPLPSSEPQKADSLRVVPHNFCPPFWVWSTGDTGRKHQDERERIWVWFSHPCPGGIWSSGHSFIPLREPCWWSLP